MQIGCFTGFGVGNGRFSLQVRAEPGVRYTTQFIGTHRGYSASTPLPHPSDSSWVRRQYSDEIGAVFAEVAGRNPSYQLRGDELYVRAKVISSRPKANPYRAGEFEVAWTQPVIPEALVERD